MNPEIKEQWLEALESGRYAQTQGQLRDSAGFCCLGVACDVVRSKVDGKWIEFPYQSQEWEFEDPESIEGTYLPERVMDFIGLANPMGCLPFCDRDSATVSLVTANDSGCTFAQISDLIRHFL